jgi:hypothetical protein
VRKRENMLADAVNKLEERSMGKPSRALPPQTVSSSNRIQPSKGGAAQQELGHRQVGAAPSTELVFVKDDNATLNEEVVTLKKEVAALLDETTSMTRLAALKDEQIAKLEQMNAQLRANAGCNDALSFGPIVV